MNWYLDPSDKEDTLFAFVILGCVATVIMYAMMLVWLLLRPIGPTAAIIVALIGMYVVVPLFTKVLFELHGKVFRFAGALFGTCIFLYSCLFGIIMVTPKYEFVMNFALYSLHAMAIGIVMAAAAGLYSLLSSAVQLRDA
jgi:hypothetical protein